MGNRRTTYVVNKRFQYAFVARNLFLLIVAFAMVFLAISLWERYQVKQGFLLRPPSNSEITAMARASNIEPGSAAYYQLFLTRAKVYTFFDILWKPLAGVLILNIIILIAANIFYSYRIAGPIHRLKKVLLQRLNGEPVEAIRFRKNDEFQELADLMTRVLDKKKNDKSTTNTAE
jgi:methyl-accepting chemotaxis protein